MLSKEVINAVKKRQFLVYQVSTIEEGIEILTGVPAGQADADGNFPQGSIYGAVQQKLKQYFQRSLESKKILE
jgi:hypothetical protein